MHALTGHAPQQTQKILNSFPDLIRSWRSIRKHSQLSLACDAGVSQRHLSFLESGRAKPSREMVIQLSEALDIPLRDRNALLAAAGFAPFYKERALTDAEMQPVYDALKRSIKHHDPYPAIVVDGNWNLLLANDATYAMLRLIGEPETIWQEVDPTGQKNIYRLTFHPKGLKPYISNWEILAPQMLARLQKEANDDPNNHQLSELLKEIIGLFEDNTQLHPNYTNLPLMPMLPMELTLMGINLKLFSMISTFGTAVDVTASELKIESFFPADAETENLFASLKTK